MAYCCPCVWGTMSFTFAISSSGFDGRPSFMYVSGTSHPDGTDVVPYTEYITLEPATNHALNVPEVFLTLILSTCAASPRMSLVSCSESVSRFHSVKRHNTVAVSPSLSFSPHPSRIICIYTPVLSKSTYSFFDTSVVVSCSKNSLSLITFICSLLCSCLWLRVLSFSGRHTIRCHHMTSE